MFLTPSLTNKWALLINACIQISLSSWGFAKGRILTLCENVCFPAQDCLGHLQKHHKYGFQSLVPPGPQRTMKQKFSPSVTTCCHLVLPGKASFTGRKLSRFAHPHNETEIWNNPNLYNNLYFCLLELSLYYIVNLK